MKALSRASPTATPRSQKRPLSSRAESIEWRRFVVELGRRFRPVKIVLDPFQGLLLADRLRAKGLGVKEYAFTSSSRAALFETLLQLIRQRRLRSFPHSVLREELAGLRWTEKAGVLRPDHPATGHDDAVVSVALAAQTIVATEGVQPLGTVTVEIIGPGYDDPRAGIRNRLRV